MTNGKVCNLVDYCFKPVSLTQSPNISDQGIQKCSKKENKRTNIIVLTVIMQSPLNILEQQREGHLCFFSSHKHFQWSIKYP